MEQIKLDLIPGKVMPVCHASQFDVGRVIRVNLTEGGAEYMLSTETAVVNVRKGDNNIVTRGVTVTSGKSYLDIVTTEQMCAIAGNNLCEIKLTKGTKLIGTLNFILEVEADPVNGGVESHSEIHNLQQQCDEWVAEAMSNYSAIIPTEHVGPASIATFTTSLALPLVAMSADIVAQQASGTPTPSSPLPISGTDEVVITHTGANLANASLVYPEYPEVTEDGKTCRKVTCGSTKKVSLKIFKPNTQYTVKMSAKCVTSGTPTVDSRGFVFFYSDGTWSSINFGTVSADWADYTATSTSGKTVVSVGTYTSDWRLNIFVDNSKFMIVEGTTATAYEPYNAETKTIALGQTVYGGEVDAKNGKLVQTWARYNDLATNISSIIKDSSSWRVYYSSEFYGSGNQYKEGLCDKLTFKTSYSGVNGNNYSIAFPASAGNQVILRNDDLSTSSDVEAFLATLDCVYPLATPTEITGLTPANFTTIAGENNIFADCGDIELTYNISIDEAIQRAIANLGAIGVPYDNSQSGLTATNVQDAIDELAGT